MTKRSRDAETLIPALPLVGGFSKTIVDKFISKKPIVTYNPAGYPTFVLVMIWIMFIMVTAL